MMAAEQERASHPGWHTAQDRMVQMIATEEIDESTKQQLYAAVEQWRKAPTPQGLSELGKKLKSAKVGEHTRGRIKFAALYLGGPAATSSIQDPRVQTDLSASAVLASAALRAMDEPVVDMGEAVKNKVDTMLLDYQARLRPDWTPSRCRPASPMRCR